MNPLAAYGLLAHALIFGALAGLLPLGPLRQRAILTMTALALLVGIAPTLHGNLGTPSLTLLQLALLHSAGRAPSPLNDRAALGLLLFAIPFYACSLGLGPFDPYALGYRPWAVLALLLPVGFALFRQRKQAWLLILSIDLVGYASGLFVNLWDALLDPLLLLLALGVLGRRGALRFSAARIR